MKAKVFASRDRHSLENAINIWLKAESLTAVNISQSSDSDGRVVVIIWY
jgi:hypothetical protein